VAAVDRSRTHAVLGAVALLAACTGDAEPTVDTARVETGEVVQTVAAVAELEPAGRVAVSAPVGGEIAELLVDDGDTVEAGDAIARLTSESIDLQIAQAEAAVRSADSLAAASGGAGIDLSPILGAFRGQLESTLPPVLDALADQAAAIEDEELRGAAQRRVADARASYEEAAAELRSAEQQAAGQARAATEAQQAAAAAQREQAELALAAAQERGDELTIAAPAAGVVELGRADGGGGGIPDVGGLADQLGGADASDLGGLLGGAAGGGDGGTTTTSGPVAEGVTLSPGQTVATVYDLSGFTARVEVDEIDVVEVAEDQAVTVLVDAFPDAELRGTITHVALAPETGPTGGSIFPVTVRLTEVPDDVQLRVGLTASAEIEVRSVEGDAVVPTAALLRRGGQEVVFVVDDGVAREVPVEVVAIGEDTAAVDGDVTAGDRVVTTGVETVEDGEEL
jgi:HlyD family secretion protein